MMTLPISLIIRHFLGDFLLQSDWMALNKSKDWIALYFHAFVYSLCFLHYGWAFMAITLWSHFVTDAITSRITSKLWFVTDHGEDPATGCRLIYYHMRKRHWFFVMIGFDQLIHYVTLTLTLRLLS